MKNKTSQHGNIQKINNSTCKLPCASKYMPAMCGKKKKKAPKGFFSNNAIQQNNHFGFPNKQ